MLWCQSRTLRNPNPLGAGLRGGLSGWRRGWLRGWLRGWSCAALLTLFPLTGHSEHVIGVFAPLTGPRAPIGQSMRNGIVLALEQAEDSGRFGDVRLSIRTLDDSGTPKAVAEQVVKFVRDELAVLVIGPVVSAQAEAAADLANHARFPMLAPGASEGITAAGRWAFRLTMSPYKTLHALAAYAVAASAAAAGSTGAGAGRARAAGRRLVLVHAKGNRGYLSQAAEFRAAAVKSGASVAGEVEADIASDFLVKTATAVRDMRADMVFFAMDAEPGAALAHTIATLNSPPADTPSSGAAVAGAGPDSPSAATPGAVQGTTIAVTGTNNSGTATAGAARAPLFVFAPAAAQPALARIGGAALEGALTAADYLPEARSERNERFRNAYRERFGIDADTWAGTGFATGQLAVEAIRNAGPNPSPETVRIALERVNNLDTLMGQGRWKQDASRNPGYTPQIYVMRAGQLVPVDLAHSGDARQPPAK